MSDETQTKDAQGEKPYVYIVQAIGTGIVIGCFSTLEKAEELAKNSPRYWVLKCEVL